MRILYLADSYRPSRSACANRSVVLVEALRQAGHDVQVLTSSDSFADAPEGYVAAENVSVFKTYPLEKKTLINRIRNNFGGTFESSRVADGMGDFDVVVCTTPPLLLTAAAVKIAKRKRAKLVLDVRDIWPDVAYEMGTFAPGSLYGRFFERLAGRAYRAADLVVTVSPGKVTKLKERVPNGRVELIPNGIDEAFLKNVEDSKFVHRFRLDEGPTCVYVGNIGLAQGLGTLLDIAAAHPDVRFLLFGKGADEAKLKTRASSEGISNVEFCGAVDARGVYTVLSHAALAYVPLVSSCLRDSVPTKLYEAFACGCPVLLAAAIDGDAASLLADCGLGTCAAPEDAMGLCSAFDQVMNMEYSDDERGAMRYAVAERHLRQRFGRDFAVLVSGMETDNK